MFSCLDTTEAELDFSRWYWAFNFSVGSLIVDYGIIYDALPELQSHLALATAKLSSGDGVLQFGDFNVSAKLSKI